MRQLARLLQGAERVAKWRNGRSQVVPKSPKLPHGELGMDSASESESDGRAGDFALRRPLDILGPLLTANFSLHSLPRPLETCGGSSGGCHEEAAATPREMDASNRLPLRGGRDECSEKVSAGPGVATSSSEGLNMPSARSWNLWEQRVGEPNEPPGREEPRILPNPELRLACRRETVCH